MKQIIKLSLDQAIRDLIAQKSYAIATCPDYQIKRLRHNSYGDYASNIAIRLAQCLRTQPHSLAQELSALIRLPVQIDHTEVGGPGFINFFISSTGLHQATCAVMRTHNVACSFDYEGILFNTESTRMNFRLIASAYKRVASVLRQIDEAGILMSQEEGLKGLHLLCLPEEQNLLMAIYEHAEVCAEWQQNPDNLMNFLQELAQGVHNYYNTVVLLCEQQAVRAARLYLLQAVLRVFNYVLHETGLCTLESR